MIIKHQCLDLSHLPNLVGLVLKPLQIEMTSRVRVLNGTTETRALIPSELVPQPSATNAKVMEFSRQLPYLVKITIIDGTLIEATELDSKEHTYHTNVETDDESSSDDVGLNCIRPTPSTLLSVVKCVPSPPAEKVDWRRTATFYTFTKI